MYYLSVFTRNFSEGIKTAKLWKSGRGLEISSKRKLEIAISPKPTKLHSSNLAHSYHSFDSAIFPSLAYNIKENGRDLGHVIPNNLHYHQQYLQYQ